MASTGTIATRYIQVVPSAEGIKGSLTSLFSGEADAAGEATGKGFGNSLVGSIGKALAAAGIAKALTDVAKKSLDAGANVQQSFGGIETIYGKAANAAKKHAKEAAAYGIDMNTYAEQAVGMGASLRQAFGGDMTRAAKSADMAIKDMADNASKMGTDVVDLQNAYAGFAKQNYTMLDNLKIGYGGTRQEMERLLSDAEKLSGVKYDINNLGDVYDAIHVIQEDLDLTGNAAKEAAETFSGSFDAMKASATNLMAEMATGGDVVGALRTLGDNVVTFVEGNLIPMLGEIIRSIPPMMSVIIDEWLPELMQKGTDLINSLADGAKQAIPNFMETALPKIEDMTAKLSESAGSMLDAGLNLIVKLAEGFAAGMPTLIQHLPQIIINITTFIAQSKFKIIEAGIKIIIALVTGLIKAIPTLVANIPQIIKAIVSTFQAFNFSNVGIEIIKKIITGITSKVGSVKTTVSGIVKDIKNAFTNVNWASVGHNIISGIIGGIKSKASSLWGTIKSIAGGTVKTAEKRLAVSSPSRVFRDRIGKNISLGMAKGIELEASSVERAVNSLTDRSVNAMGNIDVMTGSNNNDMYSLLAEWLPQLANTQIVLDDGTVVGGLIDRIDSELGRRSTVRLRGAY